MSSKQSTTILATCDSHISCMDLCGNGKALACRFCICYTYCNMWAHILVDVDIMLAVHVNANILTLEQHTGSYIMGLSIHVSCDQDWPVFQGYYLKISHISDHIVTCELIYCRTDILHELMAHERTFYDYTTCELIYFSNISTCELMAYGETFYDQIYE